jgi:biopolymer transport protein ExbB
VWREHGTLNEVMELIRHGGLAMYPLLLCSVLAVAVVLERTVVMARARVRPEELTARLRELLERGEETQAEELLRRAPRPLGSVALAGFARRGDAKERIDEAMAAAASLALDDLESNLPILGTIGSTAPFIGLFGTVVGIMRAFHDIQARGHAGLEVVAGGVSEALIATAAGLAVAVFAVVFYNLFLNRVNRLEVRLEAARSELLHLFAEETTCALPKHGVGAGVRS